MSFTESIKTCFHKYAVFEGRASRSEYWYWQLFVLLAVFVVSFVTGSEIMGNILSIALLLPSIAVAVRRMHDTGNSGWCAIVPLLNIYLCFVASDEDTNEYGDNPLI